MNVGRAVLGENIGSCGCGEVKYQLNSQIMNVVNCHCNMCKNHNGSAFSTYAALPLNSLEIVSGEEALKKYEIGNAIKHFCSECGSPIFNTNAKYPGAAMVYVGTLRSPSSYTPGVNVWCESQLPWVVGIAEINSLPQGVPSKTA